MNNQRPYSNKLNLGTIGMLILISLCIYVTFQLIFEQQIHLS